VENWGSEFLDDGGYGKMGNPAPIHQLVLPMALVLEIAEPRLIVEARNRTEKIGELRASIQAIGLQTPGVIYIDTTTARYQDGYHRLTCCIDLGYEEFPVVVIPIDSKINAKGMALQVLTGKLIKSLYTKV